MRLFVTIVSTLLLYVFITGQTPVSSTQTSTPAVTDLIKEYFALITALLAIISTILGFIYQRRNFKLELEQSKLESKKIRLELEQIKKQFVPQIVTLIGWLKKTKQHPDTLTAQVGIRSPFILGPPIIHPQNFHGRHTEAETILTLCTNGNQLQSVSILGAPKSGKTSLLNYIKHPDTLGEFNLTKIIPVYLNLQAELKSQTDFYTYILKETAKSIEKYGIATEPIPYLSQGLEVADARAFFEHAANKFKFLIILDKFEKIVKKEDFGDNFFDNLRSMSTGLDIAWITTSYRPLSKLFDNNIVSPFENVIFRNIFLGPLSKKDARELIEKPAIKGGHRFSEEDVEYILNIDRLMPFEIQVASYALHKAKTKNPSDSEIYKLNAHREYVKIMENYYQRYWRKLESNEKAILTSIASGNSITTVKTEITELINYGYIRKEKDTYHIAGAVFKDWILKNHFHA